MRRHLVVVSVTLWTFVLCAAILSAQDNMGQGAMAGEGNAKEVAAKLQKISAALQLTPQQKQQIKPILMEEAPQLQAVKANTSLGPLQKAMQLRQIGESVDAKVQPILTPEQWQKWQAMRSQERQQMIQKMQGQ